MRERIKVEQKIKEKAYRKRIKDNYKPLYPEVYKIQEVHDLLQGYCDGKWLTLLCRGFSRTLSSMQ